ncbi:MMPL family transporter [Microlunatus speluncae]|uniref:MMPL family transporter n=1 Tax=Microlunatus speluncae TaxID=2594267 RepID=UPI0012660722|nr:MMPL family transporter [Microlunatus speluncae]
MSTLLYRLGRYAVRRRLTMLIAWLVILAAVGGLAGLLGKSFDDAFTLPGTESQAALDSLSRTFPEVSGSAARIIVVAPEGESVRDAAVRDAIEDSVDRIDDLDLVKSVASPFDKNIDGAISDDDSAAIVSVQLEGAAATIPEDVRETLKHEADSIAAAVPGSTTSIGGEVFSENIPKLTPTEAIGVVIALIVLFFTLGSLRAAGMPLLTAVLGVGITMALIFAATGLATVSSTTPMLALMLGLAVGIDYALFILSRHRDQLAAGMAVEESIARAVATAGSAVVFAGLTVMIALAGLAVAQIPFLTVMGIAAAIGVAIAVAVALTLLPALVGFAGEALRPKERKRRKSRAARAAEPAEGTEPAEIPAPAKPSLGARWVRLVTKVPVITVVIVVTGLAVMSFPAKDLQLALPSDGAGAPGAPARVTYDLISDHFGPGHNGPLIVSTTIVTSDDPLGVMDGIADKLRALPGVAEVPLATPNQNAEVGIVQVIPETAPDSDETKDLVLRIRALKAEIQEEYGVTIAVTGYTAVAIDVSDRLGNALLPFGVLVVGLSLVLLTIVFRSIAVPIKATVGYLLSVGASFGATAAVFHWGWLSGPLNVHQTGPVISFLPIILMGILFGLAMDYEVFLVSRIREDYVHGGDARAAIGTGFTASAKVVTAAAVIMFAVFAAFVPEGEGAIKAIAFGLAVGVFVDAFLVRMTLVPAVLALLGKTAWRLPRWLDRRLPTFDVEGEALAHQLSLADWPRPDDDHLIYAEGIRVGAGDPLSIAVRPGDLLIMDGPDAAARRSLLLTLSGRMKLPAGRVKVVGLVLPSQAGELRARTAVLDGAWTAAELDEAVRSRAELIFVDGEGSPDGRAVLGDQLELLRELGRALVWSVPDRARVEDLVGGPYSYLTLGREHDLTPTHS